MKVWFKTTQEQQFNKVKQSGNRDFWMTYARTQHGRISACWTLHQSPIAERGSLCAFSLAISHDTYSWVLINRDFNSSRQGLWLSVLPEAVRGGSVLVKTDSPHQWHHNEEVKFKYRTRCQDVLMSENPVWPHYLFIEISPPSVHMEFLRLDLWYLPENKIHTGKSLPVRGTQRSCIAALLIPQKRSRGVEWTYGDE